MSTDRTILTAGLLLRLSLGALLLAHAFLALVALGVPAFAEALAAQGMPVPAWPLVLVELVAGVVIILGMPYRRVGGSTRHGSGSRSVCRPRVQTEETLSTRIR
jgi:hypothetical protein